MDITWLDGETVVRLNEVALYEGEPRGRNPGSDLEGALARPRGHYHQTWKRIEKEEWDEWAGCGLDALKARGGAPLR
jgi:hypothetical protein